MKTGKEGLALIEHFESLHDGDLTMIGLQPKMDPIGIWTEGYGRAMRDSKGNFLKGVANKAIAYSHITIKTREDATAALLVDLSPREHIVMQNIKVELPQNRFDAITSQVYNTGGSQTLYNMINKGASLKEIHDWWCSHYITGGGVVLKGLVLRRKAEADLFCKN